MIEIVIRFEQSTGALQVQSPANLGLSLAVLDAVKRQMVQQLLARPADSVQAVPAGILDKINGRG